MDEYPNLNANDTVAVNVSPNFFAVLCRVISFYHLQNQNFMRAFLFFVFQFMLCTLGAYAQSYSTNPPAGTYGSCPTTNYTTSSCGYAYYGNSVQRAKITSISGSTATFTGSKCAGGTYSTGSIAYLKESTSSSVSNLICATVVSEVNVSGLSSFNLTHNLGTTSGTKYYVIVVKSGSDNTRYYSNIISITTTTNSPPTAPTISSSPTSAIIGIPTSITITRGTDPQGGTTKVHSTGSNSNYTDSSPYISAYAAGGTTTSANFVFSATGTQTIYATTFKSNGSTSLPAQRTINITNTPPNNPSMNGAPTTATVGIPITIPIAIPTDPNGHTIKLEATGTNSNYTLTNKYITPFSSGNTTVYPQFTFSAAGTQTVYATCFDQYGAPSATIPLQITVSNNTASTGSITSPTANSNINGSFTVSGTAYDAQGINQITIALTQTGYSGSQNVSVYTCTSGCPNSYNWNVVINPASYGFNNGVLNLGLWIRDTPQVSTLATSTNINWSNSDGNDLPAQAIAINLNSNASTTIADQNDNDWFKFTIPSNGTGRVSFGMNVGGADMQARIFDSGILTASSPNSTTTYTVPATFDTDGNPCNNNGLGVNEFYDNIDVIGGQTYYIKVALQNTPTNNAPVTVYIDYLKNPTLTTPANSATGVSLTPTLTVENIGATQYRNQIQFNTSAWGNDPWPGLPLNQGAITTNTYTLTATQALQANTLYKWRTRGFKPCQLDPTNHSVTTKWSNEGGTDWTFTTNNTCPNTCTTFIGYTDYCAESYRAACYLQQQGVLDVGQSYTNNNTTPVNRAELAKMLSIAVHGTTYTSPAALFPNPFNDLQDPTAWYHRYAIDLSYLEYGDGISPFRRDRFNFYPANNIERRHVLKALLETFNIVPDWNGYNPASTANSTLYTDVKVNDDMYGYINKAKQLGIISSTNTTFNPYTYATREEVILMIYRVLTANPALTPVIGANSSSSYLTPGNYTPANLSAGVGAERGVFEHAEEPPFVLNGYISLPFSFGYSSQLSELPDDLAARKDDFGNYLYDFATLGRDWLHNYNSFIVNIDEASNTTDDNRLLIQLPNSHVVYNTVTNTFVTQGTFLTLTTISSTVIEIRTKGWITYRFEKLTGAYNNLYFLTAIRDRNNNAVNFTYENGYNTANTGPGTFYTIKRLKEVTDPYGRKIMFTYFANSNRLQTVRETGLNRTASFAYTNLPAANTAPRQALLASYTNAKGGVTTYVYETAAAKRDLLRQITLPKGNNIAIAYSNNRKITTLTKGTLTTTIGFTPNYAANNAITNSTLTQNGKTTTFAHNNNGLPSSITPPGASATTFSYGTGAQSTLPTNVTDNTTGLMLTATYDANGNMTQQTTIGGTYSITQSYQYNSFNDPISHTNPLGYVTTMGYNTTGNLTTITQANGAVTTIGRNSNGTISSETAPNPGGGATAISATYTYGSYGLVSSNTQSGITGNHSYTYDAAGRMTAQTDHLGRTNTYVYDANDNLLSHTAPAPLNYLTSFAYDANDNQTSITNAKGFTTTATYNTNTDLLQSVAFEGSSHNYTYNTDGTPATHTKPGGTTLSTTYNSDYTIASNGYATFAYDSRKNVTGITKDSKTIAIAYDALNRPNSTTYDNKTITYAYNNNNQNTQIGYNGSFSANYTYNNIGQCTEIRDQNNVLLYSTTYRADGLISQENYGNSTRTEYSYDAAGRLINLQNKRNNGTVICGYTHTFDAVGNITQATNTEPYPAPTLSSSTENGTYGNNNRLNTYGGDTFTHNADGNITNISGNYNATLTYDPLDNLTASSGTLNEVYEYDGTEGRRRKANTRYVLDPLHNNNVLIETDLSGNALYYYLYTPNGRLIARRNATTNATQYYHADYRGSIIAITDAAQNITHQYQYDTWGKVLQNQEPANDPNPYRYVGQHGVQYDSPRQTYMRQRYYDPNTGRFRSEDPIWSTNLFPYADNNPVTGIDPRGTFSTTGHDEIIDLAFEINEASQIFKDASKQLDAILKGGQSISNSYRHAMRSPNQTVEEAEGMYKQFIDAQINAYVKTGNYNYLGYAFHAIADSYSPFHEGFQEWNGLLHVDAPIHGIKEAFCDCDTAKNKAAEEILRVYYDAELKRKNYLSR